jgi:hypothetical protein
VAREVILSFRLRAIKKAKQAAKDVVVAIKKSTTLAKETKKELTAAAREEGKRLSAMEKAEKARKPKGLSRLGLARLRGKETRGFKGAVGLFQNAQEKGFALQSALAGGTLNPLGSFASLLGPAAAMGALVAALAPKIWETLKEQNEKELARFREEIQVRVDRAIKEADYARRLKEDPAFERQQALLAFQVVTAEEAGLALSGFSKAADFLEGF